MHEQSMQRTFIEKLQEEKQKQQVEYAALKKNTNRLMLSGKHAVKNEGDDTLIPSTYNLHISQQ